MSTENHSRQRAGHSHPTDAFGLGLFWVGSGRTSYHFSGSILHKDLEEAMTVAGGNLIVEVDVAELVEITEDNNSKKYQTNCLHHLAE